MVPESVKNFTVCVVGLGYVGTPLAEAFAGHLPTIGYDIDEVKVQALVDSGSKVRATTDPTEIRQADVILICVPTPVTKAKDPDLGPVRSATRTIGQQMKSGAIVVLESTVYPGVTEDIVVPILEQESGIRCGIEFFVGYSPERINPNDDDHTLDTITKIVSGMDEKTVNILSDLYGLVTTVYQAPDIKTAEASKVIENIQRDLNIALMNELSLIFSQMGLDTRAVLDAAGTKWNFHPYRPGLVGGHCIPVDPYYLVKKAQELGYHPQVIVAGRAINDSMPRHVAGMVIKELNRVGKVIKGSKVLIFGLTYKENVPDIRESPVEDMIHELKEFEIDVYGYDPLLQPEENEHFGAQAVIDLARFYKSTGGNVHGLIDGIVINVPHLIFSELTIEKICGICNDKPIVVDVTGMFRGDGRVRDECVYRRL